MEYVVSLVPMTCSVCGTSYAIEEQFNRENLEQKRGFSCPNGHHQAYRGKPLEQQLAETKQELRTATWELDACRTKAERAKKRVKRS